jgi:hypothetical protein
MQRRTITSRPEPSGGRRLSWPGVLPRVPVSPRLRSSKQFQEPAGANKNCYKIIQRARMWGKMVS